MFFFLKKKLRSHFDFKIGPFGPLAKTSCSMRSLWAEILICVTNLQERGSLSSQFYTA